MDLDLEQQKDPRAGISGSSGMRAACTEYIEKFHSGPSDSYQNQDIIRFMLEHPTIRKKIDGWMTQYQSYESGKINGDEGDAETEINTRLLFKKIHEYGQMKRTAGNRLFQQKKLREALECYNEALRNCDFSKAEHLIDVAICLANRSAVSLEMGKYVEALQDIHLAVDKYKYPDELKSKLRLRKLSILIKLKRFDAACELLKQCYERYFEPKETLDEIARTMEEAIQQSTEDENLGNSTTPENFLVNFKQSSAYGNAAPALQVKYSSEQGRHVVTNEDLRLGDVIYWEKPFASVLLPDYYNSHCYQCHKELNPHTFFPCKGCTQVNYCTEPCSTESWTESHQHECLRLSFLASTGIAHLAVRIVLVAGVSEVLRTVTEFKAHKTQLQKDLTIFEPGAGARPYQRVFSLLDHTREMNPEDSFQYALTATLLTHYLQTRTEFLNDTKLDEDEIVGGAILHQICQLICNANAISSVQSETSGESGRIDEFSQARIASAIYPAASLMNHSCCPNILSAFKDGRTLTVKIAVDHLPADSEVFNCYGPHFRRMNYKTRQENLAAQYFFQCKCEVCTKELQENSSFADKFSAFKCNRCGGPVQPDYDNQSFVSTCGSCSTSVNLKNSMELALETDKLFAKGMEFMDAGQVREALDEFIKCYQLRKKILFPFHSDLGNFSDCLAKCYSILGNYSEALKFTTQSLNYVQERFGLHSIEWAREFKKFMDLKSSCQVEELPPEEEGAKCADLQDPDKLRELNEIAENLINLYKCQ